MQQTIFHFLGYWKTSCALRNFLPNVFTSGLIVIPCIWYLIRFTDSKLELPVHSLHSSSIIGQGFCKKEDYFDVYNTLLQHTMLFQWWWNYKFQNWKITYLMRLKGSKNDRWYYAHKALWDTLTLYVKWKFSLPQLRTSVPQLASPVLIKITVQISLQRLQLSSFDEKPPARVNGLRSFTRRRFSRLR